MMNYSFDKNRSIFRFLFCTSGRRLLRPYVFCNIFSYVAFIQQRWYTSKVRAIRGRGIVPKPSVSQKALWSMRKFAYFPYANRLHNNDRKEWFSSSPTVRRIDNGIAG